MRQYLIVAAGAAIGANCRFIVANWAASRWGTAFPYGTMLINLSGSFAIGLVMAVLAQRAVADPAWRLLLVTGFLGAYTTFSSLAYETLALAQGGGAARAFVNMAGSAVAGTLAVILGTLVGRALG